MPTRHAVTFDFHETLASCDRWFDLEVRSLPAEVLDRLAGGAVAGGPIPDRGAVTDAYRGVRGEIVGHGVEMDARSGVVETFRRLGLSASDSSIVAAIDQLMREAMVDVAPKPGAVETVTTLRESGFALGVVSSAVHHPFLEWVLDEFGLLPLFGTVVTSASAGFYKSRPEIYRRALADLDVEASATCHVGDSVRWDHGMAKSIGMRTVLVSTEEPVDDDGLPAPDLRIPSLVGSAAAIRAVATAPAV